MKMAQDNVLQGLFRVCRPGLQGDRIVLPKSDVELGLPPAWALVRWRARTCSQLSPHTGSPKPELGALSGASVCVRIGRDFLR